MAANTYEFMLIFDPNRVASDLPAYPARFLPLGTSRGGSTVPSGRKRGHWISRSEFGKSKIVSER